MRGVPSASSPHHGAHLLIAASYEAKAYGVKTGVSVEEAKQDAPTPARRSPP